MLGAVAAGALALSGAGRYDGVSTASSSLHPAAVAAAAQLTTHSFPLGIGAGCLPDEAFTASTTRKVAGADFGPSRARLNLEAQGALDAGWRPSSADENPSVTVDLGARFEVDSIITQGGFKLSPETMAAQPAWVTSYKIETSVNGVDYDVLAGTMQGNVDGTTPALREINLLSPHDPVIARWVRIRPIECALGQSADGRHAADSEPVSAIKQPDHCSLRFEVLGKTPCKHRQCEKPRPLGAAVGGILPDASFTASSRNSTASAPHAARLHSSPKAFREGGWSPGQCPFGWNQEQCAKALPWLQVDLGQARLINAVATQGSASKPSWVSAYQLAFSNDGRRYAHLKHPLRGNADALQVVKNPLTKPVLARYVRFYPLEWHGAGNGGAACENGTHCGGTEAAETFGLRVELFGPDGYRPGEVGCRLESVASCPCSSSGGSHKQSAMVLQPGSVGEEGKDKGHQCSCGRHIPKLLRGAVVPSADLPQQGGVPIVKPTKPVKPVEEYYVWEDVPVQVVDDKKNKKAKKGKEDKPKAAAAAAAAAAKPEEAPKKEEEKKPAAAAPAPEAPAPEKK